MDIWTILGLIFAAAVLVQLLYFLLIYRKLAFYKEPQGEFMNTVSVVVCGYNEADNWKRLLPLLLEQNYPKCEIVVVNDQSNDNTRYVFKEWDWHPKLKVVTIDEHVKKGFGKKFALTLGIKAAQYDHLLLTDADCYPKDKEWIASMVQHFSDKKQIVLGYGAYEKRTGLLNKLIRFDTFQVAMQYLSYSLVGQTYMGVGRNLSYQKSLFFDNKGFASHLHIPSGDDDLFVREVATDTNTAIALSESSQTLSEPEESWAKWVRQKSRHLSTSGDYDFTHKILLGLWPLSQSLFWVLGVLFLSQLFMWEYVLALFVLRLLLQGLIYYRLMRKMEEKDLFWFFPVWELLQMLFQFIFVFSNFFKKQKNW